MVHMGQNETKRLQNYLRLINVLVLSTGEIPFLNFESSLFSETYSGVPIHAYSHT